MSRIGGVAALVTKHSKAAIAVMLVATVIVGAGAPMVGQSSSLDQFQTDNDASEKLDYINEHFQAGSENTTTVQIVVRGENVLAKEELVDTLEFERALVENETISPTLADERGVFGIANVVATGAIQAEEGRDVQELASRVRQLNQSVSEERRALEARSATVNETAERLRAELASLRQNPDASAQASFEAVAANTSVDLNQTDAATFREAADRLRNATSEEAAEAAYRLGTRGVLEAEYGELQERNHALQEDAAQLQDLATQLQEEREELENAGNASISEQIAHLESMNQSEIDSILSTALSSEGGNGGMSALALMPTDFETGSTSAEATMLVVTQRADEVTGTGQVTSDTIIDAQLAIQDLAEDRQQEYLVFGAGVITEEINDSMTDSLVIVGPLAIVFVLVALAIAYRDVVDILLGLFGIGAVLTWTFGFMGWAGIAFNQIFIAVPVLLIGLSIDYAIHIFMRHREERAGRGSGNAATEGDETPSGVRNSMRVALSGVGVALVWVTATTVIGFLSNLTSPVPPIQEFGVVSSVGIVAALLVFGVLTPALKVEIDGFLEDRGFDRRKRAFGTGGGRFSNVLAVGSTAARRAPVVVLLLTLVVTSAGAYGATQVDTSFDQEDFLAEEPPDWMHDLPEPFAPSSYSAKENLGYVNDNFVREDSQAQILIQEDVTADDTLERVQRARDLAAEQNVTQTLSNGEPLIRGPLSTMRQVAATNESFNAMFTAADTDGDGVPDRNVEALYAQLYEVAPEQAASYVHQTEDGDFAALRMVVSVEGGASGDEITTQMRDVADSFDGSGLEATATGSAILNKIVQDQLLETVVQSLLITLVAVFAFLMVTYRLTEGSATLGAVTLLPVVLSVAWILGTMYLLDIPFNVLTGMITSLTVGLGVAYSIHLSERYVQELERHDTVWSAMRTAVTGTGGALLGSAATTVGGFGVLVFAILPPLQQFGIITGLTIIYAFLASVLVLPSLLVVWTKYAGPGWADGAFEEAGAARTPEGDAAKPPDAEATSGTGIGASGGTDASAYGGVADVPEDAARTLSRDVVQPGGTLEATVRVADGNGRIALSESVRGGVVTAVDADPEPVEAVVNGDAVHVAWRLDDSAPATATYEVRVADTAPDDSDVTFAGEVLAGGDERDVSGEAAATVVADIFERVFAQADVTDDDLAAASAAFRDGDLTAEQYERVVREWARHRPEDA